MPKKCYIENEGNATLSMDDIYYHSINNSLFLANILFGNYRLPIKIYYICSRTVDEKMPCGGHSVFGFLREELLKYFSHSLVGWLLHRP